MTATEILARIQHHPGAFMRVVIESAVPTLKSVQGVSVVKRSVLYVTAGTEFANRKDVREAIEAGERGEVGPLPWGMWKQYPFIIQHTPKATGVLTDYIRFFPPSEAQLAHFNLGGTAEFFANGLSITRDEAISYCGSKAKADDQKSEAYAVAAQNVITIG